jgi:hypothetical protein
MASRCLPVLLLLLILGSPVSVSLGANPVKMRPYSGIGVVVLPGPVSGQEPPQPIYLYREPGLSRLATVTSTALPGNEWIFGRQSDHQMLIVMARKGNWLRVCYDDAGREAWIGPQRKDAFQSWELFLKSRISRMLPGLRKHYYQLYLRPDQDPGETLTPKQPFKVLKLEHDWAMVLSGQTTIGWLRWRDEDGRLTIGLD